jgi:hypothetical protein
MSIVRDFHTRQELIKHPSHVDSPRPHTRQEPEETQKHPHLTHTIKEIGAYAGPRRAPGRVPNADRPEPPPSARKPARMANLHQRPTAAAQNKRASRQSTPVPRHARTHAARPPSRTRASRSLTNPGTAAKTQHFVAARLLRCVHPCVPIQVVYRRFVPPVPRNGAVRRSAARASTRSTRRRCSMTLEWGAAPHPRPVRIGPGEKSIVASSTDSGLEAFSHNPTDGSVAPLAVQPSACTKYLNQRFLSY